ncbi:MAG: hypothetical protein EBZ69_00475 [Alphaproteobacteria bacterium]|nr:hypothetical protein [Alphaproteobacteria bacterium]
MDFKIVIKPIANLSRAEVLEMYHRLSVPGRNMRKELSKRHVHPEPGPHETITLALVWQNEFFVAWVGTRAYTEKFKGNSIAVQTIECFTDPELRRRGLAQLGLQALISAGFIDRTKPVSVYRKPAIKLAERCGCQTVILCEP